MYKFLVIAAVLAYANAGLIGAPAYATTYAAAPVAYAAAPAVSTAIGTSQQSTLRSLDGGNVVSQYSKAVDTAFSSVRKYDTRITNDARLLAPAVATYAHAAPAVATYAHAAPVVAARAYAPAVAAAPVAHAGLLGVAYSAAPAVAHIAFDGLGAHYAW
ncbi:hypothetical protein O3M35_006716 [Rhynocoris fuscipes]|uniref:Uncharacterized protein n=1 Tax=Rhynocoris fuscipes TaxID=488301 RepID=A0AAW1DM45_9HEMI